MSRRAEELTSGSPMAAAWGAVTRTARGLGDFATRVYQKAGSDDIFFLAGGIAFNFLLGAIPFLLLLVAIFGFVLQATVPNPAEAVVDYMVDILPTSPRIIE